MKFVRGVFPSDGTTLERAVLAERLSSGTWLLETGTTPPRTHEPGLLLAPMHALAGTAVSLRSTTLMRCNLGAALIDWLHTAGCTVTEHADLALHEMLLNAAIHGNLEVAAGASNVWAELDERQALIEIALKDPRRVARVVTVAVGGMKRMASPSSSMKAPAIGIRTRRGRNRAASPAAPGVV